ncbi:MAG: hypothetical protein CYPHOPRED_003733 [Cyphobasidiales sp. Tagirdzhanova-0007]|nr:MAG: hypothetical protein CYPHOPRED_003733 [Cyphobasidiales sp. Tagirdzhanova-0007]
MSYYYSLPTTGAIKFASLLSDPSNAHAADLARATNARGRVRSALKEARRSEGGNKDWSRCAAALQEYLPHLLAIIKCTENEVLLVKVEPVFSWRPTLTAARKTGRVPMHSFQYELCFVILTYALALSNISTSSVYVLGTYERDPGVSELQRKKGDEQINSAADTLCRAAGVLQYLSETLIPQLEASPGDLKDRPSEITREVAGAVSKLCLADAEKLAIRRLLSKSVAVAQATHTPGPPLPRSHPSPSLLAKLYLNVHQHYDSARALAKSVGNSATVRGTLMKNLMRDNSASTSSTDSSSDAIAQDLRTYLTDGRTFSSSLGYKWLGVDAGENANKTGEAISWLGLARTGLLELQSRAKVVMPLRKGKAERSKRKDRIVEELEDIDAFMKSYKRTNDMVLFQPVPSAESLLSQIPVGRSVLAIKSYSLPGPAFAVRRQDEKGSSDPMLAAQIAAMVVREEGDSDSDSSAIDQSLHNSNYF